MQDNIKIIATIGKFDKEIIERLKNNRVDFFRINLSHTPEENIEKIITELQKFKVPIIIDTEGNQVRSGNTNEILFEEGKELKLHANEIECDNENLFLNPKEVVYNCQEGDLISIDFNSLLLKVFDTSCLEKEGYIRCKAIIGGKVGGKKAVHIDSPTFKLPAFSKKDLIAVDLAKKHGIRHFTLSFMENPEDVARFKNLYAKAIIYSKIESKNGLKNFIEIAKLSNGVLIDRGDLSNQIPIERIPLIQKAIIDKCRKLGKEVFIATNTLEQMSSSLKPNRAEVNDIVNTILDGATGIALTKETAVGHYPVETLNMLIAIIKQLAFIKADKQESLIKNIWDTDYLYSEKVPGLLIEPHGGILIDRLSKEPYIASELPKNKIYIDEETLMDIEQIAIGSFSPLKGFMKEKDFHSVLDKMKLSNSIVWPIPIFLSVDEKTKNSLILGEDIALAYQEDKEVYAILHLEEIYCPNKEECAKKFFLTSDKNHPGVKKFLSSGDYFLGGDIILLKRRNSPYKLYELTPMQTRKIFSERGWSKVLGFHTRNVIHRSHEFIQIEGLKKAFCDGLFVHPIIGKKKTGDFEADVIINSYEKMIESFYPKSKVILCSFASYSRYAGPREALFTALARKNFGCSHFIVGRDHTGVGNFYSPNASHEIFDKFTKEEIGIVPVKFDKVFYSSLENKYIHEPDASNHPEDKKLHISGTQAREMLKQGKNPPEWFMRPEISAIILEKIKKGEKVFVENES